MKKRDSAPSRVTQMRAPVARAVSAVWQSNWKKKYPSKQITPNKIRSVGTAIAMQGSGIPLLDMGSAILKLNDDGFFNLLVGATDLGTGSDTVLSQIAAEAIGVPVDRIVIIDDFSTDETIKKVKQYQQENNRIVLIDIRRLFIKSENMFTWEIA